MNAIARRKTRPVRVGSLTIGGGAPVSVQSMAKSLTADVERTKREIRRLEKAGCELIRVAVRDADDAGALKKVRAGMRVPLVADIHFDWRLAVRAIASGADKVRVNPGNMSRPGLAEVAACAKDHGVALRIGVNSGSAAGGGLVGLARRTITFFEKRKFRDIIISVKASDVVSTVRAYEALARGCDYPFHLGVTASGLPEDGVVRSAIGIGSLLAEGIGDTIRVSLTGDACEEVRAGRRILAALGLRAFGPQVVACPTCGRCRVDLVKIVREFKETLDKRALRSARRRRPVRIAIMGCEVNGPGEAKDADIGIAAGKGCGALFRKGRIVRRIRERDFVKALLAEVNRLR